MMFKDKSYIITGGSRGIGLETAKRLAERGAGTILVASCGEALEKARKDICAVYGASGSCAPCGVYPCDLSRPENVSELFRNIVKDRGVPDGLIYCAGQAPLRPVRQTSVNVMTETFAVNFFSFVEMSRLYLKQAKPGGGSIVSVSSVSVTHPENGRLAYASSKAALEGCVKILAKEALKSSVRVNLIRSAMADTDMAESYLTLTGRAEDMRSVQPLGIIEKREIADMIIYLLSEQADKITGAVFEINGGMI